LFFVLSGFVICHAYLSPGRSSDPFNWRSFIVARFARVYPLHITTALLAAIGLIALSFGAGHWPKEVTPTQAIREFFLVQAMPLVGSDGIWNSPSWSVSVEFWTYFTVFPCLVWFGRKGDYRVALALAAASITIAIAWYVSADIGATRGAPAYYRAATGFTVGWAIWRLSQRFPLAAIPGWSVDIAALLFLAITQLGEHVAQGIPWLALLIAPYIVFGIVNTTSVTRRFMETRPVVYLGLISYSLYLLHPLVLKPVQLLAKRLPGMETNVAFYIFLTLLIVIPLSACSYRYLEQTCRDSIRARLSKRVRRGEAQAPVPGVS
jgi:peptidoglycan/LPS O-acetylase OafA/YrhL